MTTERVFGMMIVMGASLWSVDALLSITTLLAS
jgi:preprotein translocase subunit SecE